MKNKDAKLLFWIIALPFKLVFWLFRQPPQQRVRSNNTIAQTYQTNLHNQHTSTGGFVYVLSNPSMPGLLKIGMTTRPDVKWRIDELNRSTGVPFPFKLEYAHPCNDPALLEKIVHRKMATQRANQKKEFFRASVDEVKRILANS